MVCVKMTAKLRHSGRAQSPLSYAYNLLGNRIEVYAPQADGIAHRPH